MNEPIKVHLVNLRRHARYVHANLVNVETGELEVSATLAYIEQCIVDGRFEVVDPV